MNQWRSKAEEMRDLEQQIIALRTELERIKEDYHSLQQQYQTLKLQNDRLLKMEAEHQSSKESLIRKRIVLSHAVLLIPESMVIGDHMENSVIKIYRGNNLTVADTGKLINCRIIGLNRYSDSVKNKSTKPVGTIEIKGIFYNSNPRKFAISTHDRVVISPGARFMGNVRAENIIVSPLTKVRGRFVTRQLVREQEKPEQETSIPSNVLELKTAKGAL